MNCFKVRPWLLAAVGGWMAMTLTVRAADPGFRKGWIVILHTNDLDGHLTGWHGWEGDLKGKYVGGLSRVAAVVRGVRTDVGRDRVLVLDAGDAFGGTMIADLTKGKAVVESMNAVGYDATCLGCHETELALPGLEDCIKAAHFPVLAANVFTLPAHAVFTQPYVLRKVGDIQIGIIGLCDPDPAQKPPHKDEGELAVEASVPAARETVAELKRRGAQVIVALTHLGLEADEQLAQAVPEINVIVGGRSHNRVHNAHQIGHTLIVQAGAFGSDVGRLDLHVDPDGLVVSQHHELITLDHDILGGNPKTKRAVDAQEAPFRAQLDEHVAQAVTPIIRAQTLAGQETCRRDQQSPADSLFADILRQETGSDFALLPGVGYGVAIPPGPITAEALGNLLPHDPKVMTMKLTGAQLREILEQSIENVLTDDPTKEVGGMIQVSGLRFTYNPHKQPFQRVTSIRALGGKPLESAKAYTVAVPSTLADGGSNCRTFLDGQDREEHGSEYETVKAWMLKQEKVSVPADMRIVSEGISAGK